VCTICGASRLPSCRGIVVSGRVFFFVLSCLGVGVLCGVRVCLAYTSRRDLVLAHTMYSCVNCHWRMFVAGFEPLILRVRCLVWWCSVWCISVSGVLLCVSLSVLVARGFSVLAFCFLADGIRFFCSNRWWMSLCNTLLACVIYGLGCWCVLVWVSVQ